MPTVTPNTPANLAEIPIINEDPEAPTVANTEEVATGTQDIPIREETTPARSNNSLVSGNETVTVKTEVVEGTPAEPERADNTYTPNRQEPPNETQEPDRRYRTPIQWGAWYGGRTIDDLPKDFLRSMYRRGAIEDTQNWPGLKEAVVDWANRWTMLKGKHAGDRLDQVPMSYINRYILYNGQKEPKGDDLFLALTYHLPVRAPDVPGADYKLTFGKYSGDTLDEALLKNQGYIDWLKDEGIPLQEGYEGLATGIEHFEREELRTFKRANSGASKFEFPPAVFGTRHPLPIKQVTEYQMEFLCTEYDDVRRRHLGFEAPIAYWELLQKTNRWNWRREKGPEGDWAWDPKTPNKVRWASRQDGLGPLMYPTTVFVPLKEEGVVESWGTVWARYMDEYSPGKGHWKWREV